MSTCEAEVETPVFAFAFAGIPWNLVSRAEDLVGGPSQTHVLHLRSWRNNLPLWQHHCTILVEVVHAGLCPEAGLLLKECPDVARASDNL